MTFLIEREGCFARFRVGCVTSIINHPGKAGKPAIITFYEDGVPVYELEERQIVSMEVVP